MIGICSRFVSSIRLARQGWAFFKSFVSGLLYLLLAAVICVGLIPISENLADAAVELAAMPNCDYLGEVKRLRSESSDEAKQLARYVFETDGMPNQEEAKRLYDEIEKEQRHWWGRTKRIASGAITGEGRSIEELGGSLATDMFLIGDVRDLIKHSYYKVTKNEKGDSFIITLSAFGVVTEFVDVVDWVPAVLKAFRKVGALSSKMIALLSDGIKKCMKVRKMDDGVRSLFSGIKNLTEKLGFARASRVMRYADNAAEVATLARAAKVAPAETYLLVKYTGKDGLRALEDLTGAEAELLRVAAKKGPEGLSKWRRACSVVKSHTKGARTLTRLVKSIWSGHLMGFLRKLVNLFPALRFIFAVLAAVFAVLAVLKLRQAFRLGCRSQNIVQVK